MTKEQQYIAALREIEIRLEKGGDFIADLGIVAAVLKKRLAFFWVGFYFMKEERLVLGPFQGTPACVFLPLGKGVCGTCCERKEAIIAPDVDAFPGHIACDSDSRSEIVVPLFDNVGTLRGVLDVDSDRLDAFDDVDKKYLEKLGEMVKKCW